MEQIVGLKELRENLPAYEKKIMAGASFIVVKKSKPVFRISPVESEAEQMWEDVVDFTKVKKGGVEIGELLDRL